MKSGFTLIELSIVLVIIGLIVGGILTGRDLLDSASQRAQIAQIEKYNTAMHTFQNKYGYLPGDIPDPQASGFGFKARGSGATGTGDSNGIVQGYNSGLAFGTQETAGETVMFWVDMSTANLIETGLNTATSTGNSFTNVTLSQYFPSAKIGNNNYVYVYENGWYNGTKWLGTGINYYGVSSIASNNCSTGIIAPSVPGLTVLQAYNIDKKVDDGYPQSGNVTAMYLNNPLTTGQQAAWAAGGGLLGAATISNLDVPTTTATPYAATNCYDNNNVAGPQTYSLAQNANSQNCALSFKFQ